MFKASFRARIVVAVVSSIAFMLNLTFTRDRPSADVRQVATDRLL
jgi:hypothetical protein